MDTKTPQTKYTTQNILNNSYNETEGLLEVLSLDYNASHTYDLSTPGTVIDTQTISGKSYTKTYVITADTITESAWEAV